MWLVFVRGIHQSPVNSPHKRPVARKKFPFDDVIMNIKPSLNKSDLINIYVHTNGLVFIVFVIPYKTN